MLLCLLLFVVHIDHAWIIIDTLLLLQKIIVKYHVTKNVRMTSVIVVVLLSALDTLMSVQGRNTRVNRKVKAIFKLRGNRDREELAHCTVLTVPVEEFRHVQYSALPSVEWQQRGQKH